ncbi:MAG: hypothetical protein PWP07_2425 [Epulopiscium sp.]|jgi:hypothetical protein|nr:hypothetical protein [Defluviitaleaceae bacterium]MDK2789180.1 hypothetical protein [Candidatus Epulonipiscium sp.]
MRGLAKKIGLVFCVLTVITTTLYSIAKAQNHNLNPEWIKNFNDPENKNKILAVVLDNTGYSQLRDRVDQIDIKVHTGDLLGDTQKELILTVALEPKKSIIAVYQKEDGGYKYVGLVDTFFDISGVQTIPMGKKGKDIVIVREYVDQMLGAFEKGTYLRGYIWNNGQFQMVLSVIEEYQGYWNEMWDQPPKTNPRWLRVADKTDIQWENGPYPVLRTLEHQSYAKSKSTNSINMPRESEFEVVASKEVPKVYYWSEKYQHFVLNEGKDIRAGETVAIIEDLSLNPFQLAGFELNQYRIKRQDGKIEIVPKNQITDIKTPLKKPEGFHYWH